MQAPRSAFGLTLTLTLPLPLTLTLTLVQAARSAFGLGLGAQAARSPRCDALHAVVAELRLRFRHRVVRRRDGDAT